MFNIKKARIRAFTQEISQTLELHQTILFQGKGEVAAIRTTPADEGENVTFEVKPLLIDIKAQDLKETTTIAQDIVKHKSPSQGLRAHAYKVSLILGTDENELYNDAIQAGHDYLQNLEDER